MDKFLENQSNTEFQQFTITRVFGAYMEIYNLKYGTQLATLRGKFRLTKGDEKSMITVGDKVNCQLSQGSSEWSIDSIEERKNTIIRKSDYNELQILCSNVDRIGIIASLIDPETKVGFIDRCLAACHHSGIPALIIFTKSDLVLDKTEVLEKVSIYRNLGYDCRIVSALNGEGIDSVRAELDKKVTFFVGNSGSGKSTLLNLLSGSDIQKVSLISKSTRKGKHTTTNSFLYPINEVTSIIDSPGIKEWGLLHLEKADVLESFPELKIEKKDCIHFNCCDASDDCAMMTKLNSPEVSDERRKSMESMLESLQRPYRIRTGNFITGKLKKEKSKYERKEKRKKRQNYE